MTKGTKKIKPHSKEFAEFLAKKENAEFLRVKISQYEKRNFNAGKFETGDVPEKIVGV